MTTKITADVRDASGNAVVAVLLAHPETAWARGSAVTMPGVVRSQNWGTVSLDVDASADITWTVTLRVPGEWMHTEYGVRLPKEGTIRVSDLPGWTVVGDNKILPNGND